MVTIRYSSQWQKVFSVLFPFIARINPHSFLKFIIFIILIFRLLGTIVMFVHEIIRIIKLLYFYLVLLFLSSLLSSLIMASGSRCRLRSNWITITCLVLKHSAYSYLYWTDLLACWYYNIQNARSNMQLCLCIVYKIIRITKLSHSLIKQYTMIRACLWL